MDVPGGGASARVVIRVDVDDAEARAKLAALGRQLKDLDGTRGRGGRGGRGGGAAGQLDELSDSTKKFSKSVKDADHGMSRFQLFLKNLKNHLDFTGPKLFASVLKGMFKIIKYGAIELALMTTALGAMKLAMWTGQAVAKGWQAALRGIGAAAGVAVAGVATVLGAIREMQVAQMEPLYTGPLTLAQDMSGLMGDKQLAMYSKALGGIAKEQMVQTGRMDARFQQRLVRLADFAMGDDKTLTAIAAAFSKAQKEGKVTADVYSQLQQASPALAKAFEEMAGGEKAAAGTAAAGRIKFEDFMAAVQKGELEALKPFNGALAEINDTLIGRFKGALASTKEDLTRLGDGFLGLFKDPLARAEYDIHRFIVKITPTLQRVFPELVGNLTDGGGVLSKGLDRLATLVNTGMPRLIGLGSNLKEAWYGFKEILRDIGDYMERMSRPFDTLWNGLVKPLGREIATTLVYAMERFGALVDENGSALKEMGDAFHGIFEGVRGLVDVLANVKEMLQPFIVGVLKILSGLGTALGSDGFFGSFMRGLATAGVALALFGKLFYKSYMSMVKTTASVGQAFRSLFNRETETKSSTEALTGSVTTASQAMSGMGGTTTTTTQALSGMGAAATSTANAVNQLTAAEERLRASRSRGTPTTTNTLPGPSNRGLPAPTNNSGFQDPRQGWRFTGFAPPPQGPPGRYTTYRDGSVGGPKQVWYQNGYWNVARPNSGTPGGWARKAQPTGPNLSQGGYGGVALQQMGVYRLDPNNSRDRLAAQAVFAGLSANRPGYQLNPNRGLDVRSAEAMFKGLMPSSATSTDQTFGPQASAIQQAVKQGMFARRFGPSFSKDPYTGQRARFDRATGTVVGGPTDNARLLAYQRYASQATGPVTFDRATRREAWKQYTSMSGMQREKYGYTRSVVDAEGNVVGQQNMGRTRFQYFRKGGSELAKSFTTGVSKYGVGAGMAATFLGTIVSSKTSATSNTGQAIGGALSGAGTGAMLGSMFGPYGTAIGALGGGVIGAISGWLGANKEQERRRQETRDNVTGRVNEALGSRNRESDFAGAREAIEGMKSELEMMDPKSPNSIDKKIKDLEATKFDAEVAAMSEFAKWAEGQGSGLKYAAEDTKINFAGDKYTTIAAGQFYDPKTAKTFSAEDDRVEDYAHKYFAEVYKMTESQINDILGGKGDGKDASAIGRMFGSDPITKQVSAYKTKLKELEEQFKDGGAAQAQILEETKKVEDEWDRYSVNVASSMAMTGKSADELADLFDSLGLSLSDAGVGVVELNKLLGYTGDIDADRATAAGRLNDLLVGPLAQWKDGAEKNAAMREQLTKWFETRGEPMDLNSMVSMTSDTLTSLFDNAMAKYTSGEITWEQLMGGATVTKTSPTGTTYEAETQGKLFDQLDHLLMQSGDLPPDLFNMMYMQVAALKQRVEAAKDDPFERMKIDADFASKFTELTDIVKGDALVNMSQKGMSADKALDLGTDKLKAFFAENGMEVTPETEAQLKNMLGSTLLNSSTAIEQAFGEGSKVAYDMIRAAITGTPITVGLLPSDRLLLRRNGGPQDTATPRRHLVEYKMPSFGDTSSPVANTAGPRFARSMAVHRAIDATVPGKRAVTSGIRDFALGSINSDHTTGAAYDLVGDNLLAYGAEIRANGGFAEMHGGPGNRHLHVVPGVAPAGDTSSTAVLLAPRVGDGPSPVTVTQQAAPAPTVAPITVNVYGAQGQSVQALADEVMERLERKERSIRERY